MHVKQGVSRVAGAATQLRGFALRRKRAAIALLVIGPLLMTGDLEVFVLNGIGLLIAALLLRRLTRSGATRRAAKTQPTADETARRTP